MARTRTQLRQLVARQFPWPSGFTGTAGSMTATSLTDLPDLAQFSDDTLNGFWIRLTSGSPQFNDLLVTDSVQSTGVLTTQPSITGSGTLTYEVLPFNGSDVHNAIDEALLHLYDKGALSRRWWMKGLVMGSPIYNAGFEYWTSATAVDGWTLVGAGASLARERNTVNTGLGEEAAAVTRAGADATLTLDATWRRWLWDFKGHSPTLYCWVRASVASRVRIGWNNGTDTTYSSYHTGDSDWELLSVNRSIASTASDLYPVLSVDTGDTTGYFSMPWMGGGPTVEEYPIPLPILPDGPNQVLRLGQANSSRLRHLASGREILDWRFYKHHNEAAATENGVLYIPSDVSATGVRLWGMCETPLSLPAADTDNIEVSQYESLLIAKHTALNLASRRLATLRGQALLQYSTLVARLRGEVEELEKGLGGGSGAASLGPRW